MITEPITLMVGHLQCAYYEVFVLPALWEVGVSLVHRWGRGATAWWVWRAGWALCPCCWLPRRPVPWDLEAVPLVCPCKLVPVTTDARAHTSSCCLLLKNVKSLRRTHFPGLDDMTYFKRRPLKTKAL